MVPVLRVSTTARPRQRGCMGNTTVCSGHLQAYLNIDEVLEQGAPSVLMLHSDR